MSVQEDLGPPPHTMATVRSPAWQCVLVIPALKSLGRKASHSSAWVGKTWPALCKITTLTSHIAGG